MNPRTEINRFIRTANKLAEVQQCLRRARATLLVTRKSIKALNRKLIKTAKVVRQQNTPKAIEMLGEMSIIQSTILGTVNRTIDTT